MLPLVIATALTLMALDAAGFAPISGARRTVVSAGAPIGQLLGVAATPLTGIWHGAVHFDEIEEENRLLRRRNAELAGLIAGQPDAQAELEALLDATEISFLGDVERVTGRVVADRRSDVERVIEIEKGEDDGIREGMPVATGTGLVGVVQIAAADRSVIRLLTDVDVAVGVRSRHGLGLAAGDGEGPLQFTASPELAEAIRLGRVSNGTRFVTSGVDRSIYPSGIPVGSLQIITEEEGGTNLDGGGGDTPNPAGPNTAVGASSAVPPSVGPQGSTDSVLDRYTLRLEPLASLDRLGYVTVLLVEPER